MSCIVCGKRAQWVRVTQFSGEHPYCEEHAEEEDDFYSPQDSYQYWEELK